MNFTFYFHSSCIVWVSRLKLARLTYQIVNFHKVVTLFFPSMVWRGLKGKWVMEWTESHWRWVTLQNFSNPNFSMHKVHINFPTCLAYNKAWKGFLIFNPYSYMNACTHWCVIDSPCKIGSWSRWLWCAISPHNVTNSIAWFYVVNYGLWHWYLCENKRKISC